MDGLFVFQRAHVTNCRLVPLEAETASKNTCSLECRRSSHRKPNKTSGSEDASFFFFFMQRHCDRSPTKDSSNVFGRHLVLTSCYESWKPLLLRPRKEKMRVCRCLSTRQNTQNTCTRWPGCDGHEGGAAYTWPNSWAMVKAVLSPLSSLMLQLLYGSQTVPNSARPGATAHVDGNWYMDCDYIVLFSNALSTPERFTMFTHSQLGEFSCLNVCAGQRTLTQGVALVPRSADVLPAAARRRSRSAESLTSQHTVSSSGLMPTIQANCP